MTSTLQSPSNTGSRVHVALIVPASNTVMEPDFHRHAGEVFTTSTWRIVLESVTREAEIRMLREELPSCLDRIRSTVPEAVVFGCTSAGSLDGLARDIDVSKTMEAATGARPITVIGSVMQQFRKLKPARIAVFTPYIDELTTSVADVLVEAGFGVVLARGMGIVDNRQIGQVDPDHIARFVEQQLGGVAVDCVFLSCTNWQAIPAIGPLQDRLHLPVISSNQAVIDAVRHQIAQTHSPAEPPVF